MFTKSPFNRFRAFFDGILAKGIELGGCGSAGIGKGGRKLSYKTVIQSNGNLLVGKAYTGVLDLKSGNEFTIKLSKKKDPCSISVEEEEREED